MIPYKTTKTAYTDLYLYGCNKQFYNFDIVNELDQSKIIDEFPMQLMNKIYYENN